VSGHVGVVAHASIPLARLIAYGSQDAREIRRRAERRIGVTERPPAGLDADQDGAKPSRWRDISASNAERDDSTPSETRYEWRRRNTIWVVTHGSPASFGGLPTVHLEPWFHRPSPLDTRPIFVVTFVSTLDHNRGERRATRILAADEAEARMMAHDLQSSWEQLESVELEASVPE